MPEVSFVVIAYNEEKVMDRCLKSIERLDGIENAEIIVVDDGSKDRTLEIIRTHEHIDSRIRAVPLPYNQGRGAARAAGVKASRGKYIAFVDADIVLPAHWYTTCVSYMDQYDVVGGIGTPDADVNLVYTMFNLSPKLLPHTITVSGSNGLYKREIFDTIAFDASLRDGEDVVLAHALEKNNKKVFSIKTLIVEHREAKGFSGSVRWLYEMGKGATRQLKQLKTIRFPDVAALGFIMSAIVGVLAYWISGYASTLMLTPLYVIATATAHLYTRFYVRVRDVWKYPFAIVVQSILIAAYYAGRFVGIFTAHPPKGQTALLVCVDFEGKYGMSMSDPSYDLSKTTDRLLEIFEKYSVPAVFFVVGKLIEEQPELIQRIAAHGHHIALHGYDHVHLDRCDSAYLQKFSEDMDRTIQSVHALTGAYPRGFRSPFLMAPAFYTEQLYQTLEKLNITWVSNRSIRHESEFLQPGRLPFARIILKSTWIRTALFLLLNWRFVMTDSVTGVQRFSPIKNARWLMSPMPPFRRGSLVEVPAHAPFDCELVGTPSPSEKTSQEFVDYAIQSLIENVVTARGFFNITFHDWIIGSNNRIDILEKTLESIAHNRRVRIVSPDIFTSV